MSDRFAILDLGTNTFHLLVAETSGKILYRDRQAVKIGRGGINEARILPDAIDRAVSCLKSFRQKLDELDVQQIHAFGTSALRVAANRREILDRILAETGINVNILTGEQEAELIYLGVRKALNLGDDKTLIVDIGGGSVEFIITGRNHQPWMISLEIGGQRLLERFQHHDPILPEEITKLNAYLHEALRPVLLAIRQYHPEWLVGSSGTFDTLSEIYCHQQGLCYSAESPETPLTREGFYAIYEELIQKDRAERLSIPGMIEMRVDMIVVACCLIKFLLDYHSFSGIRVSTYAMKEGVLEKLLTNVSP
jgi:exopolyphosphatase/guanosine-5'-triphosphate,3'-diphosphate pyrophosphatase